MGFLGDNRLERERWRAEAAETRAEQERERADQERERAFQLLAELLETRKKSWDMMEVRVRRLEERLNSDTAGSE